MILRILLFITAIHFTGLVNATNYYVNVERGSDANAGTAASPLKTISKAIQLTKPGDTVTIVKVNFPIRDKISIGNKSGLPGQPITIDGQGNVFTGADKLKPAEWQQMRPGLYKNNHLLPGLKPGDPVSQATMMRFFMLWNGKMNRMGRSSKAVLTPFVDTARIKPGEWTYVEAETAFYIAIEPSRKLEDYNIEIPTRQNGFGTGGTCNHWVVRNINVTHFINDGFNIHGHTEDFVFDHNTATECGDDGISAHEDCSIVIHYFTGKRNSTGMTHGDYNVTCVADNLILEDNYAYNLMLWNGTTTISKSKIAAVVPAMAYAGIRLKNAPVANSPAFLTVTFNDCHFSFAPLNPTDKPGSILVDDGVKLNISKDTRVDGKITFLPPKKSN